MTKAPLVLGKKIPNPPCSGQGRRGDMRMSKKHLTHLGLEARTLSAHPLPPPRHFLLVPHGGTR